MKLIMHNSKEIPKIHKVKMYLKKFGNCIVFMDKNKEHQMFNYRGYMGYLLNDWCTQWDDHIPDLWKVIDMLDVELKKVINPDGVFKCYIEKEEYIYHLQIIARQKQIKDWDVLRKILKKGGYKWSL
tara:strand:+ start:891 stop:1271 length:381 start_codon:yes stop_codon:yes gene_type:complete